MPDNPYEPSFEYGSDAGFVPPHAGARPNSVTVFGILNLAFALWTAFGFLMMAFVVLGNMPGPRWYYGFATVFHLVKAVLLVVGGVGLLRWRPIGRQASIVYGWLALLMVLLQVCLQTIYMMQNFGQPEPFTVSLISGLIGGLIGVVFSCWYPVLLLIYMNNKRVKLALSGAASV